MRTLIICICFVGISLFAQTPNTNDIATAWNVQFNYSTNQKAGVVWAYRSYTNSIPATNAIPSLTDWHRDLVKASAARMSDDYVRQKNEEIMNKADETKIRAALPDATDEQIAQIKTILRIN